MNFKIYVEYIYYAIVANLTKGPHMVLSYQFIILYSRCFDGYFFLYFFIF